MELIEALEASQATLEVTGARDLVWYRKPAGARRGPWKTAEYQVHRPDLWVNQGNIVYFVHRGDEVAYVGKSRQGLRLRWRLSPAYPTEDFAAPAPERRLFHSQCWSRMQASSFEEPYTISVLPESTIRSMASGSDLPKAVDALEQSSISQLGPGAWNQR